MDGRRDRTSLALTLQNGITVSELITLACGGVVLGAGAHAWQETAQDDAYRSIPPLQLCKGDSALAMFAMVWRCIAYGAAARHGKRGPSIKEKNHAADINRGGRTARKDSRDCRLNIPCPPLAVMANNAYDREKCGSRLGMKALAQVPPIQVNLPVLGLDSIATASALLHRWAVFDV